MVDPEQLGRAAVDLDPPLRVPGVAQHQQPVGASLHRRLDPGLVAPFHLDLGRVGRPGQPVHGLLDQRPLPQRVAGLEPGHAGGRVGDHVDVVVQAGQGAVPAAPR